VMPFTSSWKKKANAWVLSAVLLPGGAPAQGKRAAGQLTGCQPFQLLGISWYLPAELILKRKNFPWTTSPLESN